MKEREIIADIEAKEDSCYREIAKEYLKHYEQYNNFQKSIFIEIICRLIEEHCSIPEVLSKMSKEYGINCKKVVISAIKPLIRIENKIKTKINYLLNKEEALLGCIMVMKIDVVNEAFKYDNSLV